MRSIQMAVTSAGICFRRRLNNSKTYLALAVMAIFSFYIFSPVCQLASYYQISCPPWLFPFFMSFPIMLMVHGGLCLLLFSDGGENDGYSYLMLARCGRKATMMGRLLVVLLTSFLYALILLVFSVVFILPVLGWDSDWGTLLRTLAESSGIMAEQTGVSLSFVVSPECIALFTPFQAVGISFLCLWLSTAFIGVLITFCRVYWEKSVGIIAAGFFVGIALFALYLGLITIGYWLQFVSPLSWSNFMNLDWYHSGATPSPVYAFSAWGISILGMSVAAVVGFDKRDIQ